MPPFSTIAALGHLPHGCTYLNPYLFAYLSCALPLTVDASLPSVGKENLVVYRRSGLAVPNLPHPMNNGKGAEMAGILEGKRALATGGHRGIGRSIVEAFVSAGALTVIADVQGPEAAAEEIGRGTTGVTCDVRSTESVAAAVAEATRALGGRDIALDLLASAPNEAAPLST
jgi:Enoyl-(Acyl carrier protein) reductase